MESFTSVKASGCSTKRGRRTASGGGEAGVQVVASCVVDGCNADMSKCRDYHRRHKVCELHSKTPSVTIRGLQLRFCQQCSRFHSLEEFDEGKRSCRKRLEGHNRRRRKPQPEPLPLNPTNFISSTTQPLLGSNSFLAFNNNPMNTPTSSLVSNTNSYSHSHAYKVRQFPFLQGPNIHFHVGPSFHHNNCSNNNNHNNGQQMLCNGLMDSESTSALSLLSSSSTETLEMGLGRVVDQGPMGPSQWAHNIGPYPTGNLHGLDLDAFQHSRPSDGSSSSGGHQTLSFWE